MAKTDPKKLAALVDQHAKKKAPPKKPNPGGNPFAKKSKGDDGGGGGQPGKDKSKGDHDQDGAGGGEDNDHELAEQQASRVANGNGDDELHDLAGDVNLDSDEVPEFALDEEMWRRAVKAVDSIGDVEDGDRAAVVVHTYEAIGGEIEGRDVGGDDDDGGGDQDGGGNDGDAGDAGEDQQ